MRTIVLSALWPSIAAACWTPAGKVDPDADSGGLRGECFVIVDATYPADGATDAYYRDPIVFVLSDVEPGATVTAPVPGTTTFEDDGERVIFTPDAPLQPSTSYTFRLDFCDGGVDLSFTTSSLGSTPVEVDFSGRLYALALDRGRPRLPEGLATVITNYLHTVLLGVVAHDGGVLELSLARPDDDAQDYCGATGGFPVVDYGEEPYFAAEGAAVTMLASGNEVPLYDIAVTGVFAPEGDWIGGATFSATLDTRNAGAIVVAPGDPGAICDAAIRFGTECVPCPDGEPYCLSLVVDQLAAMEVTGVSLVEVPADDCAGCETGPPPTCP